MNLAIYYTERFTEIYSDFKDVHISTQQFCCEVISDCQHQIEKYKSMKTNDKEFIRRLIHANQDQIDYFQEIFDSHKVYDC